MFGKLIVLFGIDGSGKSTILKMLNDSNLNNTICTSCLKNTVFEEELHRAEKALNFSRKNVFSKEFKHALHIESVIYNTFNNVLPILKNEKNVILDRYVICVKSFTEVFLKSSYNCISESLNCLPNPDLGIYFDVDINVAYNRIKERSKKTDIPIHYSESKNALLMKKRYYEESIPSESYPIKTIDANKSLDEVYEEVLKIINENIYS